MAVDTLSGAKAASKTGKRSRAATSGSYQNTGSKSIGAMLPGEIGTPQQRLEVLQDEITLTRAAGLSVRLDNVTTKAGRKCLVIVVMDAMLHDECFWHVPLPESEDAA